MIMTGIGRKRDDEHKIRHNVNPITEVLYDDVSQSEQRTGPGDSPSRLPLLDTHDALTARNIKR